MWRALCGPLTFRTIGIRAYHDAGGTLEIAQGMAAHSDPKTTRLYDSTGDEVSLDEVAGSHHGIVDSGSNTFPRLHPPSPPPRELTLGRSPS